MMRQVQMCVLLLTAFLANFLTTAVAGAPDTTVHKGARQLSTFTVHYADPAQLESVVRTYLSAGSSVSLYKNQLVVNATAQELAKTESLLRQLDVGGRQLLISVKTSGRANEAERGLSVSGVRSGGSSMPAPTYAQTQTRTTVTVKQYQSSRGTSAGQGVRATEGEPTFISTGQTAPLNYYRGGTNDQKKIEQPFIDAQSGFYATAWVNENTVRIAIDQRQQQFEGRVIEGQQLQSQVSGVLGAWIPIGVITESAKARASDIGRSDVGLSNSMQTIYLKVEALK